MFWMNHFLAKIYCTVLNRAFIHCMNTLHAIRYVSRSFSVDISSFYEDTYVLKLPNKKYKCW